MTVHWGNTGGFRGSPGKMIGKIPVPRLRLGHEFFRELPLRHRLASPHVYLSRGKSKTRHRKLHIDLVLWTGDLPLPSLFQELPQLRGHHAVAVGVEVDAVRFIDLVPAGGQKVAAIMEVWLVT